MTQERQEPGGGSQAGSTAPEPDGGSQAGSTAPEPVGETVPDPGRRPWWRNPALTVPAAATVLAAVIAGVVPGWRDKPPTPPVSSAPAGPTATAPHVAPTTPASGVPDTPAPAPSSTAPTTAQPSADAPTVRRAQDGLLIQGGYTIDLDELPQDDPSWGYRESIFTSDVHLSTDGTLWADYLQVPTAPTKADCEQPGYLNDGQIADDDVTEGMVLCVKSSDGRYARVTVRQVSRKPHSIRIDVLVWK
ncbi:hypothetical protein ACFU3J_22740 [Streptomyces sp. NPDC057411]|uniref:hypothetical protein n=1 Tax=unclassified Streptomyces TaxID=2593676 RepID=UPI003643B0D1